MTFTIANGAANSNAVALKHLDITAIQCPAALTGTELTLIGGVSNVVADMVPIHGSEFPALTAEIVVITTTLRGIPYIAIRSNASEGAERTFVAYTD